MSGMFDYRGAHDGTAAAPRVEALMHALPSSRNQGACRDLLRERLQTLDFPFR